MPTYVNEWHDDTRQLTLFQRPSVHERGRFYYRLQIAGQARKEGLVAAEFQYSPLHLASAGRQFDFESVRRNGPPEEIVEFGKRILYKYREQVGKGKRLNPRRTPTVSEAAKAYLDDLLALHDLGRVSWTKYEHHRCFLARYVASYEPFTKRPIDEIDFVDLTEWQRWRDTYWLTGPGASIDAIESVRGGKPFVRKISPKEKTIPTATSKSKEWGYLKAVFKFARSERHLSTIPDHVPTTPETPSSPSRVTPYFTAQDWKHLTESTTIWLNPAKLPGDNRRIRQLCWWFCLVLRAYGLRVAEGYQLKFRSLLHDVIPGTEDMYVKLQVNAVKSKVHPRSVEPIDSMRAEITNLLMKRLPAFYQEQYGRWPASTDPLWMHSDGSAIRTFEGSFDSLLKHAKMTHDVYGHDYDLTSIRHTTITDEIETTDLSVGVIATWAGTSINMLDKTYNHATTTRARRQERERRERLRAMAAQTRST
ncbi:hypothetical protein [Magnetospirillum moscoviense]|uniref:Tyr recombinase domain-containing protein n=1 Tax=Magnetospirillum moscoviense TaxID=1437059 RepID=A0A178ME40_9PROT|nr:hypothetical protein [Magnetospirillum moscoviense]OAN46298.1 hypothetical protein A6A05_16210 [Magnetospirillum moscoviense]